MEICYDFHALSKLSFLFLSSMSEIEKFNYIPESMKLWNQKGE